MTGVSGRNPLALVAALGLLFSPTYQTHARVDFGRRERDIDLNPVQAAKARGDKTRGIKSKGRQGARARSQLMMRALGQPLA